MPLLDHFRPPLSPRRQWHAFHNSWATYLAAAINRQLPEAYFAEANGQFGSDIDVAADGSVTARDRDALDPIEVLVYQDEDDDVLWLTGAVEFITPSIKADPLAQDRFVSRCVAYDAHTVGFILVDVVTDPGANLHNELMGRMGPGGKLLESELYAVSYRPCYRNGVPGMDVCDYTLQLGAPLPTLSLWLPREICLQVDLEETYTRTCQEQRVPANGV